jgi:hypothetical protein
VLYRGLTGRRPFTAREVVGLIGQILAAAPEPPSAVLPGLPMAVDEVLGKAMALNPADRFGTCTEFAEEFTAAFRGGNRFWRDVKSRVSGQRWLRRFGSTG